MKIHYKYLLPLVCITLAQGKATTGGEGRSLGWAFVSALGTLLLNHLQLRLCRVHLRFRVRPAARASTLHGAPPRCPA